MIVALLEDTNAARQPRLAVALSATSKRTAAMVMSAKTDLTHVCWALRP